MLICLPFAGFSQSIKKVSLFNNQVEISLPVEFEISDDLEGENKLLFTDKGHTIKFSLTWLNEDVTDNDIPGYTDLAITAVKKESASAKIYDDGISLNSGKNIGYIKYSYNTNRLSPFEYVFYGSLNDKLLTLYFSCKPEERSKWEKKIDAMVASLKILDKPTQ